MNKLIITSLLFSCCVAAATELPFEVPDLPKMRGSVINVRTETELQNAVTQAKDNCIILIHPGTYKLTKSLNLNKPAKNMKIVGATGKASDVILQGPGMNSANEQLMYGFIVGREAKSLLIAFMTIRDFPRHSVTIMAEADGFHMYGCHLLDCGRQYIRGGLEGEKGVNRGIFEYNVVEYTSEAPTGDTNGLRLHIADGWIIRNNLFRNIRTSHGLAGAAVMLRQNSKNTICENNIFYNCHVGIAYGWSDRPNEHEGGVIRNNIFYRAKDQRGDVGIALWNSSGTKVQHNTVFLNGTYGNAIEYRFPGMKDALIQYNLCDAAVRQRNEAQADVKDNITDADSNWLMDPEHGDFRLRMTASTSKKVINRARPDKDIDTDYEGDPRPAGRLSDIGADEVTPKQLKRKPKNTQDLNTHKPQVEDTPEQGNDRPVIEHERPPVKENDKPPVKKEEEIEVF